MTHMIIRNGVEISEDFKPWYTLFREYIDEQAMKKVGLYSIRNLVTDYALKLNDEGLHGLDIFNNFDVHELTLYLEREGYLVGCPCEDNPKVSLI